MVALTKGANPLGRGVASDDQQQAAKAAKMVDYDGQMLHPDVLDGFKWDKEQFSRWLSAAKAQIERSQICISTLSSQLQLSFEGSQHSQRDELARAFGALREQLDRVPTELNNVLDDFCRFSSAYHWKRAAEVSSGEQEGFESVRADLTPLQSLHDMPPKIHTLRVAISRAVPYIERMGQFYEADQEVFAAANAPKLQAQDSEFLDRATTLHNILTHLVETLSEFDNFVRNVTGSVSSA